MTDQTASEVGRGATSSDRYGSMGARRRNYFTIGEVIKLLEPDFPDISISKLRFLETQGLIEPDRTDSGYRKFVPGDIERLRFILREQRDRFLPLRVIRTRVEQWEKGELQEQDGVVDRPGAGAGDVDIDISDSAREIRYSRSELADAGGLAPERIEALERFGLLTSRVDDDGRTFYDECALVVVKIARGFLRYGVEARHLRMFAQAADREAALFHQIVAPMIAHNTDQGRRDAIASLGELASSSKQLRQALLAQNLRSAT